MRRFIDTTIFVYTVDPREPVKQAVARRVVQDSIGDGTLVLSTQVMQEFYRVTTRRHLLGEAAAAELLESWAMERVVGATAQSMLHAIELQRQLGLSMWDALIVRSALDAGCTQLVTEDLQHGMRIGELEVVNPFLQPPAAHEPRAAYRSPRPRRATAR